MKTTINHKVNRLSKKPAAESRAAKGATIFVVSTLLLLIAYFGCHPRKDDRQTITFGEIGRYGRLGNQLFQVASTVGIARTRNLKYAFPKRIEESVVGGMFNIKGTIPDISLASIPIMHEAKEGFYDVQIPANNPLVSLHGYFQSHFYFSQHNDELKRIMKFRPTIIKNVQAGCPEVNLPNTLGIHIRRTDYLQYPDLYRVLDHQYYKKALELLYNSNISLNGIIIATDDRVEAVYLLRFIQSLGLYNIPTVISPFSEPAYDLALLSMCRHLIIANSSFSWWAAYLNMLHSYNGTVIAPSPWYKPDGGLSHLNSPQFYLPHWRVLHEDLLK
jgi:Glycosyl transferase family 11